MLELRAFLTVDPAPSLWTEIDFAAEQMAESYAQRLPTIIDEAQRNIAIRDLALDRGLRKLIVERRKHTVRVSLSMLPQDAQPWVVAVNQAIDAWSAAGSAEGVSASIGRRLVPVDYRDDAGITRVRGKKEPTYLPRQPRKR